MAGTTAAVDFLAALADTDTLGEPGTPLPDATHESRRERIVAGMKAVHEHELALLDVLEPALRDLPGVTVHSNAAKRTPTLLFSVDGRDPQEVRAALAEHGVNAPAGNFYALECSRHLGLGDTGAVRVGLAPYTSEDDVDRLVTALRGIV